MKLNIEFINYLKKILLKTVLHMFWIFPIDKKKITLLNELSYTYGDSMKYLDQYIHRLKKSKYKVVFPIKRDAQDSEFYDDIIVRPFTFRYFKEVLTSGTIITNAGGVSYLPKRRGQLIVSTWHGGGPYKKTNTDVFDNFWYKKQAKMNSDNTNFILSSCKYFTEIEAQSMGYRPREIIPAGLPRNDILFSVHDDVKEKVRKKYGIKNDTKLVLFAPTFRSIDSEFSNMNIKDDYIELDVGLLVETLKEKYGCDWVCGIRLHPKLSDIDISGENVINCTSYPDMQELLCCADAVVTDYSSLMWDFSFTYRPIFLYAPDIESYEKERGFYMPTSKWPYPIAQSNEELRKKILDFNYDEYVDKVKKHHIESGSYEKGNACKKVMKLINLNKKQYREKNNVLC